MNNRVAPPPILDSARVLAYANVPEDMPFTGRIHLHAGGDWVGRVPNLAICRNYYKPDDILLLFCDEEWNSRGCIPFGCVEEAKLTAERGYAGISAFWMEDQYDEAATNEFLRDVYEVDPTSEWWRYRCSFCQNDVQGSGITDGWATICVACADKFHAAFHADDA